MTGFWVSSCFKKCRKSSSHVSYGMDRTEHDREGRIITLEMEDFFLVNVYTPNSQEGLKRLEYRMTWEDDFLHFLKQLETVELQIQLSRLHFRLLQTEEVGIQLSEYIGESFVVTST